MPKSRVLLSRLRRSDRRAFRSAPRPLSPKCPSFDGVNYALQGVIKAIEQTMSDTP